MPGEEKVFCVAPEVMLGEQPTTASDVYSFGPLLYQIAIGQFPFQEFGAEQAIKKLLAGERPELPSTWHPQFR